MDETSCTTRLCRGCGLLIPLEPVSGRCPTCGLDPDASMGGGEWGVPVPPGYQILAKVGQGGMGAVYKAQDYRLDRVVALKYLTVTNKELVARFVREGQILARLVHQRIIRVYGYEVLQDSPLLICEFVEGESLADVLQREGKFLPARALWFIKQCLEALSAAHAMDVIHRDLKLENLLVSGTEEVKLADFGVASCRDVSSGGTGSGIIVGTPSYMAPEQAMGTHTDARADLYSVGVMLFELLTGRLPFEDPNPIKVMEMQVKKQPMLINRLDPSIGVELTALVAKCLEKDPDRRYQSAEELQQALNAPELVRTMRRTARLRVPEGTGRSTAKSQALLTSDSMTAIPILPRRGLSEPAMPEPERRRKAGAAAVAVVLVVILAGFFGRHLGEVTVITLNFESLTVGWEERGMVFRVPARPPVPGTFVALDGTKETQIPASPEGDELVATLPLILWNGCSLRFQPDAPRTEASPPSFSYAGIRGQIRKEVDLLFVKAGMLTDPGRLHAPKMGQGNADELKTVEWHLQALRSNVAQKGVNETRLRDLMKLRSTTSLTAGQVSADLRFMWNQMLKVAPIAIRLAPRLVRDSSLDTQERQLMLDTYHLIRLFGRLVDMQGQLGTKDFEELASLLGPQELPEAGPDAVFEGRLDRKIFFFHQGDQSALLTMAQVADVAGANKIEDVVNSLELELAPKSGTVQGEVVSAALVIKAYTPNLQHNVMQSADVLWVTLNGRRAYLADQSILDGKTNLIVIPVEPGLVSPRKNRVHLVREAVGNWELAEIKDAPIEQFVSVEWAQLRVWTRAADGP